MPFLYEELLKYSESDYYPFHMPGHKRNRDSGFNDPFHYDITEIEGFDNLHHSDGIILDAQKRAAVLYSSSETFFLVNGSTCGLLSAIAACTTRGGEILIARNCHKSVYNAVFLNELRVIYTYPQKESKYCVNCGLNAEEIKQLLITSKNIQAVVITSPTYDGIVSDVESIAKEVHKYNIPLIVDEAHGAHFGFHSYFPINSISKGADIVIHSVHKTLPSLTQTALLHVNGNIVNRDRLKKYLSIYQTSSPSYVLMGSIDNCINLLTTSGKELFNVYVDSLAYLRNRLVQLKHIKIVNEDIIGNNNIFDIDKSKLILSVKNTDISANELYLKLLNKYHLQMEMVAGNYVLGMTSIMDTTNGYSRLINALSEIDKDVNTAIDNNNISYNDADINEKAEVYYTIAESARFNASAIDIEKSEGKISGEYIYLYPPGVPLIVPGEIISKELINQIMLYRKSGLLLEGLKDYTNKMIEIIEKE